MSRRELVIPILLVIWSVVVAVVIIRGIMGEPISPDGIPRWFVWLCAGVVIGGVIWMTIASRPLGRHRPWRRDRSDEP